MQIKAKTEKYVPGTEGSWENALFLVKIKPLMENRKSKDRAPSATGMAKGNA